MSQLETKQGSGLIYGLTRMAVSRPVAIAMLCIGVGLLGWLSLDRLGVELLPDVSAPKVLVRIDSGDRPPEDMEEAYARPVEGLLSTVRGVTEVSSVSRVGRTLVVATFPWGTDMDRALLDVQKAVAQVGSDQEVEELLVLRYDPSAAPILVLGLTAPAGTMGLEEVRRQAEELVRPALERIEGVAMARVSGGQEMELVVEPDPHLLKAYGLESGEIISRIQSANLDASGGTVEDSGRVLVVKGKGRVHHPDEIRNVTVAYQGHSGNQEPVFLGDLATVELRPKERKSVVLIDDGEGVAVALFKEAGANTVLVSGRIQEVVEQLNSSLPGIELTIIREQARFIREAIGEVGEAAIFGAILAFFVLWLFLRRLGTTFVVALSIPVSIIATFVLMYFAGLSLNIMTLGGLALGAGMLVDNAIVVMESIFRHRERGADSAEASAQGAAEVGTAVGASTLTSCVVFLPVIFLSGMAAELFQEQALVVAFSLMASLVVALLVVPTLASRLVKAKKTGFGSVEQGGLKATMFGSVLRALIRRKKLVAVVGLALLLLQIPLFMRIGTEFLPRASAGEFSLEMELSPGSRVEASAAVASLVMSKIREAAGEDLAHVMADVGQVEEDAWLRTEEVPGEESVTVHVVLAKGASVSGNAIAEAVTPFLDRLLDTDFQWQLGESSMMEGLGAGASAIELEIRGPELDILRQLSGDVAERIRENLTGILDVTTSFQDLREELVLQPDRYVMAAFGMDLQSLSASIRRKIEGEIISTYETEEGERDISLRFQDLRPDDLAALNIESPAGAQLRLSDLVTIKSSLAPREVFRRGQSRVGLLQVGVAPGSKYPQVISDLEGLAASMHLPSGYRILVGGEERQRRESFQEMRFAFLLALILVYMVLASLFESLVHPFTILLSVPLAGSGVAVAFLIYGQPLSAMALIGIVFLAGIAVNDTVLLVDYAGQLRRQGIDREAAVLEAARVRLRPILMTSLTTIVALFPMALGFGAGASLRAPLAVAVIGGLIASTTLTLLVLPSVYLLIDNLRPRRVREEARAYEN